MQLNHHAEITCYEFADAFLHDLKVKRFNAGKSTIQVSNAWKRNSAFKITELSRFLVPDQVTFMNANEFIASFEWGAVNVTVTNLQFAVEFIGDSEEIKKITEKIDGSFERVGPLLRWIYNTDGESTKIPLSTRPLVDGAYPWIKEPIIDYFNRFMDSSASVLVLIGPPGTGKTSFLKNMIAHVNQGATITYDTKVMSTDTLFVDFMNSHDSFLILEDADNFLSAREDGNDMMHRFLNVSDGLISTDHKKLIFTTNLPSIASIDEALIRPGRCFDVLEFRPLTREEAAVPAKYLGIDIPDGSSFTLAELCDQQRSVVPGAEKYQRQKVGFLK
jgi:hypothetical protein